MEGTTGSGLEFGEKVRRRLAWKRVRPSIQTFSFYVLAVAATLIVPVTPATAQISPGALSRPHQSLSGPTNCTACHRISAGQPSFKCVECHTEIGSRITAHRGLHATYNLAPGSSQGCVRCHSEHNGEDFPLIRWDPKTFDHTQTGYALEGKHAGLACNRCHIAEHVSPAERGEIKVKDLNQTYLGISPSCTTCHRDEHNGRLGQNCLQCHNYNDWKGVTVSKFDHSKTRYPLTGMHRQVACQKCHTPGPDNKPRYTGITFSTCSDCHADPHHGTFTQTCQSCHNTENWKRISTSVLDRGFDHSKTKFPLLGKHAAVECTACHSGGDFKKTLLFAKCMDCHKDAHNGQFTTRADGGECASCHTVDGFKPTTFGLKQHQLTDYPLRGGHVTLQCSQCHIPKGKDTQYKIAFQHCTDCHSDQHGGQFAAAPYFNNCASCHNLDGYKPSTFTLAEHKQTRFVLTGGHIAIPCSECHKISNDFKPKPTQKYHWQSLDCTSCHEDPHRGEFAGRMQQAGSDGKPLGCQACHSTESWHDLSRFDHSTTVFPLLGAHRATACMDCHKPPTMETTLEHVNFARAPTKCELCHEDIHGKQFARDGITPCAGCHDTARWKPSLFDHDRRTSFPLRGVHRNVACQGCHKETRIVEGKSVLFYKPTPRKCSDCHGPNSKTMRSGESASLPTSQLR